MEIDHESWNVWNMAADGMGNFGSRGLQVGIDCESTLPRSNFMMKKVLVYVIIYGLGLAVGASRAACPSYSCGDSTSSCWVAYFDTCPPGGDPCTIRLCSGSLGGCPTESNNTICGSDCASNQCLADHS